MRDVGETMAVREGKRTLKEILGVLSEIAHLIQSSLDADQTFDAVLGLINEVVAFESGTLFLLDGESGQLKVVAIRGGKVDLIDSVGFGYGRGFSAWVAQERQPVLLSNIHRGKGFRERPFRSFLSVPLVAEGKLVGVVNLGHSCPEAFDEEDLDVLNIAVGQISVIVEKLLLVADLKRTKEELERVNLELRETQERLLESERLATLGQIAVSINHEVNNPLMIISGNAQLLLTQMKGAGEGVGQKLQVILQQVERIAEITRQLRTIRQPVVEEYIPGDAKMIDLQNSDGG